MANVTEADVEIFRQHMAKIPGHRCPVCGSKSWGVVGIQTGAALVNGAVSLGGPVTPVLLVSCTTCWHVQHFAWLPIKAAAEAAKGGSGV